ncbi:MAG: DUF5916 domain-containing protein [Saprospiraceae bacterium]|jgi:hypothetical protein
MKHSFFILLSLLFCNSLLFSQKKNASFEYPIHRAAHPIHIDGSGADSAWSKAAIASDFYMVLPMDTSKAQVRTEVRMLYDDLNLYLLAVCYEKVPGPYMVESLRRDFNFGKNDNFLLFLDPFDDQTNGFTFGSNAEGAQWDGLLFDGGSANLGWDNKWVSEVHAEDDKWTFEMAVPFKTLRYKSGITRWGVNFSRLDLKTTEKSSWTPVPRQFPTASLAYTGVLVWDEPPPPPGLNFAVIPYLLGNTSKDYVSGKEGKTGFDAGLDAKISITSALNLDLAVNPDFSQVEVDRQQINLDRFELFFPERRQFFLENGDLFNNFGYASIRPFFSRRIGLNTNIQYGARLSGKLDKNWRIGLMDMQTSANDQGIPAQNFAVFALQRQLFARSNITALAINKETFDFESISDPSRVSRYNRNVGFEYNLLSSNNFWRGKLLYLKSFSPNLSGKDQILAGNIQFNNRKWTYGLQYEQVGKNYRADVGYVPRTGYQYLNAQVGRLFFTQSGPLLSHGPLLMSNSYLDPAGRQTEYTHVFIYRLSYKNRSELMLWTARDYVRLLSAFDPTNFSGHQLASGTTHHWGSFGGDFTSKPQSLFTWSASWRYGGYYARGKRLRLGGDLGYRLQPHAAITMSVNYNYLSFDEDPVLPLALKNSKWNFWLLGPRIDLTLTNKLFFTNFVQFNNQNKNVNLNLRVQWRYSPASDFFIVYTDNYASENLQIRNRALVAKWTFWWNG